MSGKDQNNRHSAGSSKALLKLTEELQSIVSGLVGDENDPEVEKGLERIRTIKEELARSPECSASSAVRQRAEELISQTEARLIKLRRQLAQKRAAQKGEAMEKIAARREAESDVFGAITPPAFAEAVSAFEHKLEKPVKKEASHEELGSAPEEEPIKKDEAGAPSPTPTPTPTPAPVPAEPKLPESKWNRSYRLAAHMAGSMLEDAKYFEKLRKDAVKPGPKLPAPADHAAAEAHFKSVHGLNVRLVNIELKVKAIAEAYKNNAPVKDLFKTASNEIENFMRDYKARRAESPEMSAEYERLFGGYAERFASIAPDKGGEILDRCMEEQRHREPAAAEHGGHGRDMIRSDH